LKGTTIEVYKVRLFLRLDDPKAEYNNNNALVFDLLKKENEEPDEPLATGVNFDANGSPVNGLAYAKPFEGQAVGLGQW
jgi:hypothetical protein